MSLPINTLSSDENDILIGSILTLVLFSKQTILNGISLNSVIDNERFKNILLCFEKLYDIELNNGDNVNKIMQSDKYKDLINKLVLKDVK